MPRVARIVERWDRRFLDRCFSPDEQSYCLRYRDPAPHFAARFAAKEAFYKALSRGKPVGIWFRDAEVVRHDAGGPTLALSPRAERLAQEEGLTRIHLTLTHDGEYASAVVVLERAS